MICCTDRATAKFNAVRLKFDISVKIELSRLMSILLYGSCSINTDNITVQTEISLLNCTSGSARVGNFK